MKKIFLAISILISSIIILSACSSSEKAHNEIRVGTISGPETQLMETARDVARQKYGLTIKIIEFTDYPLPNAALSEGSLEANVFQHQPYLEEEIKNKQYKLVAIGKTFIFPMGIYSKKLAKSELANLKDGAIVAIPNDPSNEGRALLLLKQAGIIQLKPGVGFLAVPRDISANPKHIQIKEIEAAQLPRVLPDVDLAVINTNYAALADLSPGRDALFVENKESPYANLIVVRSEDINNPKLQQLVQALHSDEVKESAAKLFKGQAFPAW